MANNLADALMIQQARDQLFNQPQMVDPTDFSSKYNTPLTPAETAAYQAWLQTLPDYQRNTRDYDMQGAFKAGLGRSGNGHFPDTFKKPNHPTFSDQSKYSGQEGYVGGKWDELPNDRWSFTPGVSQVRNPVLDPDYVREYFARAEKGNVLKDGSK
jgi:hypothetical protein